MFGNSIAGDVDPRGSFWRHRRPGHNGFEQANRCPSSGSLSGTGGVRTSCNKEWRCQCPVPVRSGKAHCGKSASCRESGDRHRRQHLCHLQQPARAEVACIRLQSNAQGGCDAVRHRDHEPYRPGVQPHRRPVRLQPLRRQHLCGRSGRKSPSLSGGHGYCDGHRLRSSRKFIRRGSKRHHLQDRTRKRDLRVCHSRTQHCGLPSCLRPG